MMGVDAIRMLTSLLLAACVAIGCGRAWGDEPPPLARCDLQQVPAGTDVRQNAGVAQSFAAGPEDAASHYRRGPSGDWEVPLEVDRNDPHVRLLLATPTGPLLVELAAYVDGRAFRAIREEWIDEVLKAHDAQAGSLHERSENADSVTPVNGIDASNQSSDAETSAETSTSTGVFHRAAARERLARYVSRSRTAVQRDEARWLLSQWVPGPAVLEFTSDFAAERALVAPLWAMLDEDGDRELSRSELSTATTRIRLRDVDEDDWVDAGELTSGVSPVVPLWTPRPLVTVLSESTDWQRLGAQLSQLYDANADQPHRSLLASRLQEFRVRDFAALSPVELARLTTMTADVALRVDLGNEPARAVGIAVLRLSPHLRSRDEPLAPTQQAITLRLDGCDIEFTAAQTASPAADKQAYGQIAVGGVLDGSPLMRLIDADRDGRLSLRECDAVRSVLSPWDENSDGALSSREIPIPIRLTVTLGPHAHQVLRTASRAPLIARPTKVTAPDWFVGMDTNHDNDLTPAEFLGTKPQFVGLDQDGNGRVSAREASAAAAP